MPPTRGAVAYHPLSPHAPSAPCAHGALTVRLAYAHTARCPQLPPLPLAAAHADTARQLKRLFAAALTLEV